MTRPIVAFAHNRRWIVGEVIRWSGDPDRRGWILDTHGRLWTGRYPVWCLRPGEVTPLGDVPLTAEAAEEARTQIQSLMHLPHVRIQMEAAGQRSTPTALPRSGRPATNVPDPPLALADGRSSRLSIPFTRYLTWAENVDAFNRSLQLLRHRNPRWYETFCASLYDGDSLRAIAEKLGISPANARKRRQRAHRFLRTTYDALAGQSHDI